MVLLLTKNLILSDIFRLQPRFIGPFQVMSIGSGTYCLDPPPSMAAVYPWFHTSLFKPDVPHSDLPPALENDSYEVEDIFQINKHGTHSKVKCPGYNYYYSQWIKLSELK